MTCLIPESFSRPKYRPDIDGMRALAILFVLIFHAYPTAIPGGFVGVDIFFVISGYLISSIIFRGLSLGTFSFFDFYARRIRRIFPAVTAVVIGSFILGFYFLTPFEQEDLISEAPYAAFFMENWRLYVTTGGYWETATELKPLMHFWSLGVEEQYYIFYPLICFLLWKVSAKRFLASLFFMLIVSFGLCVYDTFIEPVRAFYSLHSRFWELLIGGMLAYVELKWPNYKDKLTITNTALANNLFSYSGFLLIILAVLFLEEGKGFPGWRALLPTLGSVLIISAGTSASLNAKVFSNKLMVFIGLLSYPLYLWHWPFICIFRNNLGGVLPEGILMVCLITMSILMAYLTYVFIERPMRSKKADIKLVLALCLLLCLISLGTKFAFRKSQILENLMFSGIPEVLLNERREPPASSFKDEICTEKFGNQQYFCRTNGKSPKILIVGDSHARLMWYALEKYPIIQPFYLVANDGGAVFDDAYLPFRRIENQKATRNVWDVLRNFDDIDTVVFRGYWGAYFKNDFFSLQNNDWSPEEKFLNHWRRLFIELNHLGKRVVVVLDNPPLSRGLLTSCLPLQRIHLLPKADSCFLSYENIDKDHEKARLLLTQEARKWGNVKLIDLESVLCRHNKCAVMLGGNLYYRDEDHLSVDGNILVWKYLDSEFFSKKNFGFEH